MLQVSISKIKASLSEYLNRAAYGRERIVVLSRGKPKAAIISMEDLRRFEDFEDALAAVEAIGAYERGETVPWKQVREQLTGEYGEVQD